jgi:sulfide:quinone oxidoreductase
VQAAKDGYKVVIVGGGSAGATVAAHYARKFPGQVAVIEPSEHHYYAPLWTLVGGGFKNITESRRSEREVLPKEVDWLQSSVSEFQPEHNRVTLNDGKGTINYDYLVVATGKQSNIRTPFRQISISAVVLCT